MFSKTIIKPNTYYDSVTLMSLSSEILKIDGVEEAVVSMGTKMNRDLLKNVGLDTDESNSAGDNDLIIAVEAESEEIYQQAYQKIEDLLDNNQSEGEEKEELRPKTINSAVKDFSEANLAVISVPGQYAAREAKIALEKGLHVMLFSDNVPVEDEKEIKELGKERGLLVMGPDCGTAAINNYGLCFANDVQEGNIGLVAASGTGLQEVMVLVDRYGGGISQGIGTGGRDLKEEIGGIMMIEGLKALANDPETDVITLISKPPAKSVEQKILKEVEKIDKEVVVCFLEGDAATTLEAGAEFAPSLNDAAIKSVKLAGYDPDQIMDFESKNETMNKIKNAKNKLTSKQSYVRGLFSGGTLCAEALAILREEVDTIKSNIAKKESEKLSDLDQYEGNVLLDMGEDEFTVGQPHPMIEPALKVDIILQEAKDETVGVILLDFELGFGSHQDPAGETIEAIKEAQEIAAKDNRELAFVGYICGTENDKQNYQQQKKKLNDAGVILGQSNVDAARIAAEILA